MSDSLVHGLFSTEFRRALLASHEKNTGDNVMLPHSMDVPPHSDDLFCKTMTDWHTGQNRLFSICQEGHHRSLTHHARRTSSVFLEGAANKRVPQNHNNNLALVFDQPPEPTNTIW